MAFICILASILVWVCTGFLFPKIEDRFCSDRRACPHLRGTLVGFFIINLNHFFPIDLYLLVFANDVEKDLLSELLHFFLCSNFQGCGIVTSLGVFIQGIVHLTEMR